MTATTAAAIPKANPPPLSPPSEFKVWEKCLIALAVLLFLSSTYLYVTNYPLRQYLFNIDDEGRGKSIGTVTLKLGGLRRQFNGESEFKSIPLAETLFNEDTLVTGPESSATLTLADGGTIEMAPSTMVRLRFQTNLSLGGISRAAIVDVVAGTVKPVKTSVNSPKVVIRKAERRIEAPVPAPVVVVTPPPKPKIEVPPIKNVELIAPINGTQLALDKGTQIPEKPVSFAWRVSPADRPVQLTLWKLASRAPGAPRTQIYREVLADHAGQGIANWTLMAPGLYEWEILGPKGEPLPGGKKKFADFTLAPDFEAIEPFEPLIDGELISSNKFDGRAHKNFDITLRWKPYPSAAKYRISIKSQADAKRPLLEKTVSRPRYLFNKNKVYNGQIYYEVVAPLEGGFIAHSPLKPFIFTFLAPPLVAPANHTRISMAALTRKDDDDDENMESEDSSILITWQKTNFTEWYEVELAKDPDFKEIVGQKTLTENFYLFKAPPLGKYYWRVRSSSKSVLSPYSAPFDLEIAP